MEYYGLTEPPFDITPNPRFLFFSPKHREAFCIEPYTCVTDAINLAAQGFDTGWRTLPSGECWQAALEFLFHALG